MAVLSRHGDTLVCYLAPGTVLAQLNTGEAAWRAVRSLLPRTWLTPVKNQRKVCQAKRAVIEASAAASPEQWDEDIIKRHMGASGAQYAAAVEAAQGSLQASRERCAVCERLGPDLLCCAR